MSKFQTIERCGHKFIPERVPRHKNCELCWFVFFNTYGGLTQAVEELYAKHGPEPVIKLRGKKFLENFLKFMSTIAAWKAAKEEAERQQKEKNVSNSTTEGTDEAGKDGLEDRRYYPSDFN